MTQVRTQIKQKMLNATPFVILLLCKIAVAEELQANKDESLECGSKCGCNQMYVYDPVGDRCLINFDKVMRKIEIPYPKPQQIFIEGEEIFKGIMVSVLLFMVCAGVCIVTACVYCCRINYTDRRLKSDVKALANKLKKNYNSKKIPKKRMPTPPEAESCNVVVEPAGLYVV
ncbi:uncharacterized protein LOC113491840 isoform X2 [Trichoplusia ni]|uniref:Uncharacterized protein LOC113491840 isoform X2 n=1 Tax=Trichoplusia ni TaxID=7111 RepID=A0A7E5V969_TRINI|nr:uncharacterized protein LOC113491840 isoform X2 [Trichoplusia ni]